MRVLEIIDVYKDGGAEKVFDNFHSYCISNNINIKRLYFYKSISRPDDAFLFKNNAKTLIGKIIQQFLALVLLKQHLKKFSYDSIVSFLDRSNIVTILAANRRKISVTVTVHNPPTIQYMKLGKNRKLVFKILCYCYNLKNIKVVAVSKQVRDSLVEIGVQNVDIVYNPLSAISTDVDKKMKEFDFIFVGRLSYQKAPWKLVKALYLLKQKFNVDYKCLIVGGGEYEQKLKKLCSSLELNENIFFTGYVSNPIDYIQKSKCMVFTSFFEGFPITVLEAFSNNVPVIGSKCAIPNEVYDTTQYSNFYYQNSENFEDFNSDTFSKDDMSYSKILFHALSSQNELNNIARLGKEWILENCKISNFEEYLT